MASEQQQPPQVHGQPTVLHRLSHTELATSPLLPSLVSTINAAYEATHKPPYLPAGMQRLANAEQLLRELAPSATLYVLSQDGKAIGAIVAEAYAPALADDADPKAVAFRPQLEGDGAGELRRVIRFFVVDPALQGQGIGAWLGRLLEDEAKREARAIEGVERVRLGLATAEEVNGAYYTRRGWRTTRRTPMPAGSFESPEGFTAQWMDKVLPLN
ncbi:hypothetical protein AURDEDRAFT_183396 [Auricularia subglabra TFB-10046 SS5]|nr:hypothetical protein AURDEDRAFT_183396 [Auricularia subglabra TFB-10046 SS5]